MPSLHLKRSVEQNPGLADAWLYTGICHAHLGASEDAISSFDRVTGLNPKNTEALVRKGMALVTLGRYRRGNHGL